MSQISKKNIPCFVAHKEWPFLSLLITLRALLRPLLMPECHKFSNHCLINCYNDIYDGAQLVHVLYFDSVFRLPCGKSKHVIFTIDIPSMDKSRNIFHEIFRVSTPHKEWPKPAGCDFIERTHTVFFTVEVIN